MIRRYLGSVLSLTELPPMDAPATCATFYIDVFKVRQVYQYDPEPPLLHPPPLHVWAAARVVGGILGGGLPRPGLHGAGDGRLAGGGVPGSARGHPGGGQAGTLARG